MVNIEIYKNTLKLDGEISLLKTLGNCSNLLIDLLNRASTSSQNGIDVTLWNHIDVSMTLFRQIMSVSYSVLVHLIFDRRLFGSVFEC